MQDLIEKSKYQSNETQYFIGYLMIFLGFVFFFIGWYCCIVSKLLMPDTGHTVLDWIKNDYYYVSVWPSMLLEAILMTWFNWMAMKYFRHA